MSYLRDLVCTSELVKLLLPGLDLYRLDLLHLLHLRMHPLWHRLKLLHLEWLHDPLNNLLHHLDWLLDQRHLHLRELCCFAYSKMLHACVLRRKGVACYPVLLSWLSNQPRCPFEIPSIGWDSTSYSLWFLCLASQQEPEAVLTIESWATSVANECLGKGRGQAKSDAHEKKLITTGGAHFSWVSFPPLKSFQKGTY